MYERILPQHPGEILKKDYEYKRNGSAHVFCAVEPKAGVYINQVTENRGGAEFAQFLNLLSEQYKVLIKSFL